ncbi:MAG: ABC transporter permease [Desertimonas sp.]
MAWIALKRIGQGVLQLIAVVFLIFVLISASPGDPAARVAGEAATAEQIAEVREEMGLNRSILVQFGEWMGDAASGDLGASLVTNESIDAIIGRTFAPTLSMLVVSMAITLVVGGLGGMLAAIRPGGVVDRAVVASTSIAVAIPGFFLGLVLVKWFAVDLGWFPAVGYKPFLDSPTTWLHHIFLPSVALSTVTAAEVTRQLRGSLTDVLQSEYIVSARARGVPRRSLIVRHGLKNAVLPVLTILGVRVSQLIGGTVVIETVFNIDGMGRTLVNAAITADIDVVLGVTVVATVAVIITNLAIELIQPLLNPRLRAR